MMRNAFLLLIMALSGCGSDSDSDSDVRLGKCLSDSDICQFQSGVSTQEQVRAKLGGAQQYVDANVWVYTCQKVQSQQILRNDLVVFEFDGAGVLSDVRVLRQGSEATPAPSCIEQPLGRLDRGRCATQKG